MNMSTYFHFVCLQPSKIHDMVIGGSVFASGTQLHLKTERQTDKVKYVVSILPKNVFLFAEVSKS